MRSSACQKRTRQQQAAYRMHVPHSATDGEVRQSREFFFSSRRRHTRCYRDWSSDVCSSDLCLGSSGQKHEGGRDQKILLIQQLSEAHDLREAHRQLEDASERFPEDAGFDNLLGVVEAQEGNYADAEESFRQALKRTPKFTGA